MTTKTELFHWQEPKADEIGSCVHQFLQKLQQPSLISQQGRDTSRCRLMITLLHGNEPSGLKALWRWLKSEQKPEVTSYFFIGVVEAALEEPGFVHRHFPHLRDLNRCFEGPFDDVPGQIASTLLNLIEALKPEATLDVHNTSGSGPSFAVSFSDSPSHIALSSLFTERLLLTETRLGAIMEKTTEALPIVTIECGGAIDPESERVAWDGLQRFLTLNNVLQEPPHDWQMEVLTDPIRITLTEHASIAYSETPSAEADLTLPPDIEHLNFGRIQANTPLAALKQPGTSVIQAKDGRGNVRTEELFEARGAELFSRVGLKAFMITTNPQIAKSDCLCYVVVDDGED